MQLMDKSIKSIIILMFILLFAQMINGDEIIYGKVEKNAYYCEVGEICEQPELSQGYMVLDTCGNGVCRGSEVGEDLGYNGGWFCGGRYVNIETNEAHCGGCNNGCNGICCDTQCLPAGSECLIESKVTVLDVFYCRLDCCGDGICSAVEFLETDDYGNNPNYCEKDCSQNDSIMEEFPTIPQNEDVNNQTFVALNVQGDKVNSSIGLYSNYTGDGKYELFDTDYLFYEDYVNVTEEIGEYSVIYPRLDPLTAKPMNERQTMIVSDDGTHFFDYDLSHLIVQKLNAGYDLIGNKLIRPGTPEIYIFDDRLEQAFFDMGLVINHISFSDGNTTRIVSNNVTVYQVRQSEHVYDEAVFVNSMLGSNAFVPSMLLDWSALTLSGSLSNSNANSGSSGASSNNYAPKTGSMTSMNNKFGDSNGNKGFVGPGKYANVDKNNNSGQIFSIGFGLAEDIARYLNDFIPPLGQALQDWRSQVDGYFDENLNPRQEWQNSVCGNSRPLQPRSFAPPRINPTDEYITLGLVAKSYGKQAPYKYNIDWKITNNLGKELEFSILLDERILKEIKLANGNIMSDRIIIESGEEYTKVKIVLKNHILRNGHSQFENVVKKQNSSWYSSAEVDIY